MALCIHMYHLNGCVCLCNSVSEHPVNKICSLKCPVLFVCIADNCSSFLRRNVGYFYSFSSSKALHLFAKESQQQIFFLSLVTYMWHEKMSQKRIRGATHSSNCKAHVRRVSVEHWSGICTRRGMKHFSHPPEPNL